MLARARDDNDDAIQVVGAGLGRRSCCCATDLSVVGVLCERQSPRRRHEPRPIGVITSGVVGTEAVPSGCPHARACATGRDTLTRRRRVARKLTKVLIAVGDNVTVLGGGSGERCCTLGPFAKPNLESNSIHFH